MTTSEMIIFSLVFVQSSLAEVKAEVRTLGSHDCLIFSVCFEAMRIAKHSTKIIRSFLRLFGLRHVHAEDRASC